MPERSQKRKFRSDQLTSQINEEVASSTNDENTLLSDRDFEDISNKIENKVSKRLRDTELNQREILKLIESLSSKVDNLSNASSEQGCLTDRVENSGNSADEVEEVDLGRGESSNSSRPMKWARETLFSQWDLFICSLSACFVAFNNITTVHSLPNKIVFSMYPVNEQTRLKNLLLLSVFLAIAEKIKIYKFQPLSKLTPEWRSKIISLSMCLDF